MRKGYNWQSDWVLIVIIADYGQLPKSLKKRTRHIVVKSSPSVKPALLVSVEELSFVLFLYIIICPWHLRCMTELWEEFAFVVWVNFIKKLACHKVFCVICDGPLRDSRLLVVVVAKLHTVKRKLNCVNCMTSTTLWLTQETGNSLCCKTHSDLVFSERV